MNGYAINKVSIVFAGALLLGSNVMANDVDVVGAVFHKSSSNKWSVAVTLKHDDTGWAHYANAWRVVDIEGTVLGERVLHHPHVNEQPFTRGLSEVVISKNTDVVYIEAHDKVHGWASNRLMVDMNKAVNGHLQVRQ